MAKEITEKNIENMGLYYLERYSTTSAHFQKVMTEKIKRRCKRENIYFSIFYIALLKKVIKKFLELGYLNDKTYIESKVRLGYASGKSSRKIRSILMQKGVETNIIDQALARYKEEHEDQADPDFIAAVRYMKKKRMGCFIKPGTEQDKEKFFRRMAYGGFSYGLSQKLLDLPLLEAEDYLY